MLNEIAALYGQSPALFAGSLALIGLIVGSFLNVVIHRLPLMLEREWRTQATEWLSGAATESAVAAIECQPRLTLSTPRSACPICKAPIKAWHNIPVVSWLVLRGRCAACDGRIPARYPLVELTTALLSAWVGWHFGFGASVACALLITWALIALAGIDIDHQLLPDALTLPLMWAGLLAAVVLGPSGAGMELHVSARDAIIGGAAGYSSLWLVFHGFRLLTGKEGMGYGDFKLFAALGAWLGWKMLPLILVLSAGAGAIIGVTLILLRGRDRAAPMPFGPYLAIAGWIAMMYGNELVGSYLRLSGLRQ